MTGLDVGVLEVDFDVTELDAGVRELGVTGRNSELKSLGGVLAADVVEVAREGGLFVAGVDSGDRVMLDRGGVFGSLFLVDRAASKALACCLACEYM